VQQGFQVLIFITKIRSSPKISEEAKQMKSEVGKKKEVETILG